MPILHGANLSPFVRKVRFALAIKGVEYEQTQVVPFGQSDEFMKISPLGKIPVYEDQGQAIPDSSVIIDYIERVHPEPPIYPTNPLQRARALFYEEYSDTKLTEVLSTPFFQRFIRPNFFQQDSDEEIVKTTLEEKAPPIWDYFESQLDESDYLVGDSLGIADIAVASPFVNFALSGESLPADRWPKLSALVQRVHGHPALKPIVEADMAVQSI